MRRVVVGILCGYFATVTAIGAEVAMAAPTHAAPSDDDTSVHQGGETAVDSTRDRPVGTYVTKSGLFGYPFVSLAYRIF